MRRRDDGRVQLDLGNLGGGSERLVVSVEKDGKPIGRSALVSPPAHDAPFEAKVLEARNTIFSQELWHELHRESHLLVSYGVRTNGSSITYAPEAADAKISLELATNGKGSTAVDVKTSGAGSDAAETAHLALHLLLSHAHRQNEMARLKPMPPNQPRLRSHNQYHLLRPIIARVLHQRSIENCTKYVGDLTRILRNAGIPSATFTLTTHLVQPSDALTASSRSQQPNSAAQALIDAMLAPPDYQIEVTLTPDTRLYVRGRTWLLPYTTTQYQIHLQPAPDSTDPKTNPLFTSYPPFREGYSDLNNLIYYLRLATARAVTDYYLQKVESISPSVTSTDSKTGGPVIEENDNNQLQWAKSIKGTSIRDNALNSTDIRFEVREVNARPQLEVLASWRRQDQTPQTLRAWWHADGTSQSVKNCKLDAFVFTVAKTRNKAA
jgi:mediator of RNA polymerase II transcription subunit 17, fungi type